MSIVRPTKLGLTEISRSLPDMFKICSGYEMLGKTHSTFCYTNPILYFVFSVCNSPIQGARGFNMYRIFSNTKVESNASGRLYFYNAECDAIPAYQTLLLGAVRPNLYQFYKTKILLAH